MKKTLFAITAVVAVTVVVFALAELVFRITTNAPSGRFAGLFPGRTGLFAESAEIEMLWGPIPYRVTTNSLGFRGPEIELPKPDGVLRIAALGDSFTDGFFVDNEHTYPFHLQELLRKRGMGRTEVVNCARGGGSIDLELTILKQHAAALDPDLVILLFCTNDISDLHNRDRKALVNHPLAGHPGVLDQLHRWLLTSTAVGEITFDRYLNLRFESYRNHQDSLQLGAPRYRIPGAHDIKANCALFNSRVETTAAGVLTQQFSATTRQQFDNYMFVLEELRRHTESLGASLLFAYLPAYTQVYDPSTPMTIRDELQQACAKRSIRFCDLTDPFRSAARHQILHLAPVDFHLNPAGNRLLAGSIADCLIESELLSAPPGLQNQ